MDANGTQMMEAVLRRGSISQADLRRVERIPDDAMDFVIDVLPRATSAKQKINGLTILIHLGVRVSDKNGSDRLPEVFDAAASLLGDADEKVRMCATRMVVGTIDQLRSLGRPLEAVGGVRRVWETLQRAFKAGPRLTERRMLERTLAGLEPML